MAVHWSAPSTGDRASVMQGGGNYDHINGAKDLQRAGPPFLPFPIFSPNFILLLKFVTSSKNQMKVNQAGLI